MSVPACGVIFRGTGGAVPPMSVDASGAGVPDIGVRRRGTIGGGLALGEAPPINVETVLAGRGGGFEPALGEVDFDEPSAAASTSASAPISSALP
jgi:hypothetical protein